MLNQKTFEFVVGRKKYFQQTCQDISIEFNKDKINIGYLASKVSVLKNVRYLTICNGTYKGYLYSDW